MKQNEIVLKNITRIKTLLDQMLEPMSEETRTKISTELFKIDKRLEDTKEINVNVMNPLFCKFAKILTKL